jgi:hypothetical protein
VDDSSFGLAWDAASESGTNLTRPRFANASPLSSVVSGESEFDEALPRIRLGVRDVHPLAHRARRIERVPTAADARQREGLGARGAVSELYGDAAALPTSRHDLSVRPFEARHSEQSPAREVRVVGHDGVDEVIPRHRVEQARPARRI